MILYALTMIWFDMIIKNESFISCNLINDNWIIDEVVSCVSRAKQSGPVKYKYSKISASWPWNFTHFIRPACVGPFFLEKLSLHCLSLMCFVSFSPDWPRHFTPRCLDQFQFATEDPILFHWALHDEAPFACPAGGALLARSFPSQSFCTDYGDIVPWQDFFQIISNFYAIFEIVTKAHIIIYNVSWVLRMHSP